MSRSRALDLPPPSGTADDAALKDGLHPRNRHRGRYDFPALIASTPALAPFVARNAYGDDSIDFADPLAVKALNQALLKHVYRIDHWHLPEGFLCPPIPGRADYLHYAADLLAESNGGKISLGKRVRVLDIGVGANCVYPLIGHREYGWSFVGSETNSKALAAAQRNVAENRGLTSVIECRWQRDPQQCFTGVLKADEVFDLTICNPPFHSSLAEAHAGTQRKLHNLGKQPRGKREAAPVLNFGGQDAELWCPGGEAAFVGRMITESAEIPQHCRWFTSLIAQEANVPEILAALKAVHPRDSRVIAMAQGQKRSRLVAWTFMSADERASTSR